MHALPRCSQAELAAEGRGYTATKHQREVGTGYFDAVSTVVSAGASSTLALVGSTEASQFIAEAC
jgi:isocitrate lyase